MKATITIDEQQLEALNQLVTVGVSLIGDWEAERSPEVGLAHDWLNSARHSLTAAAEDPTPLGWTVGCRDQSDGVYVAEPADQLSKAEVMEWVVEHLDSPDWEGFGLTIEPTLPAQLESPSVEGSALGDTSQRIEQLREKSKASLDAGVMEAGLSLMKAGTLAWGTEASDGQLLRAMAERSAGNTEELTSKVCQNPDVLQALDRAISAVVKTLHQVYAVEAEQ